MLTDAGPLVALIDADEDAHEDCVAVAGSATPPLVTTWPAFTEAMHLLRGAGGWPAQRQLWQMVRRGALNVESLDPDAVERAYALMERYSDHPMDLADATLVALAEAGGLSRIFTLDRDFAAYRRHGRHPFELVP